LTQIQICCKYAIRLIIECYRKNVRSCSSDLFDFVATHITLLR